jgi:hypothetical protein
MAVFNFSDMPRVAAIITPAGRWRRVLATSDAYWGGPGSALPDEVDGATGSLSVTVPGESAVLFERVCGE